jgi:hypothetical protein
MVLLVMRVMAVLRETWVHRIACYASMIKRLVGWPGSLLLELALQLSRVPRTALLLGPCVCSWWGRGI